MLHVDLLDTLTLTHRVKPLTQSAVTLQPPKGPHLPKATCHPISEPSRLLVDRQTVDTHPLPPRVTHTYHNSWKPFEKPPTKGKARVGVTGSVMSAMHRTPSFTAPRPRLSIQDAATNEQKTGQSGSKWCQNFLSPLPEGEGSGVRA